MTADTPATAPWSILALAALLFIATLAISTPADADLWGHIAFGRDIIATGDLVQADRYSFASDRAWVNHEWLAEVVFAGAYRAGGSPTLVALKAVMIAALLAVVWGTARWRGASASARLSLVLLAFAGTYWRMHNVRPQLFSVLFFALLLLLLLLADTGRRRALLAIPPLMAVWVNLHGGWIVGIGALGVWTVARLWRRDQTTSARIALLLLSTAALVATLVNPFGYRMWAFLADTVRPGRADIEEWGSILTSPMALGLPWAITTTVALLAIRRSGLLRDPARLAIVGGLAVASFRVSRLDAFYVVSVVLLFSREFASMWPSRSTATDHSILRTRAAAVAITLGAVAIMLVPVVQIARPYVTCVPIDGAWAPDREAARFIAANHLTGRLLTWFDWGEYALWHFGPSLRVSIDGRRETVYSEHVIEGHRRFYAGDDSAATWLATMAPDYIWLPVRAPVTTQLARFGWTAIFHNNSSSVFARPEAGPFLPVSPDALAPRCFPGP